MVSQPSSSARTSASPMVRTEPLRERKDMTPLPRGFNSGWCLSQIGCDRLYCELGMAESAMRLKVSAPRAVRISRSELVSLLNQLDDKGSRRLDDEVEMPAKAARWEPMLWNTAINFKCHSQPPRFPWRAFRAPGPYCLIFAEARPCTGFAQRFGNGGRLLYDRVERPEGRVPRGAPEFRLGDGLFVLVDLAISSDQHMGLRAGKC